MLEETRGGDMTSIPHEPSSLVRRSVLFELRDLWASLAIAVIWLSVLLTSLFGPDFVGYSNDGNAHDDPVRDLRRTLRLVRDDVRGEMGLQQEDIGRLIGQP